MSRPPRAHHFVGCPRRPLAGLGAIAGFPTRTTIFVGVTIANLTRLRYGEHVHLHFQLRENAWIDYIRNDTPADNVNKGRGVFEDVAAVADDYTPPRNVEAPLSRPPKIATCCGHAQADLVCIPAECAEIHGDAGRHRGRSASSFGLLLLNQCSS